MNKYLLKSWMVGMALYGCGSGETKLNEVATDSFESKVFYFYGENSDIVRTTCEANKPALKNFCATDAVRIDERKLKDSFGLELQRQAKAASDGIAPLEAEYARLDGLYVESKKKSEEINLELTQLQTRRDQS